MADARIQLQPLSVGLHSDRQVYVGWDQALQSYYAHVIDGVDDGGNTHFTLRVGTNPGEILEPSPVLEAARRYADVPDDLADLLNIGRVSTYHTVTDLRPDSRIYQREQHFYEKMSQLYRPGGFATKISHDQVNPVLAEHGWTLTDVRAINGGHAETYRREGHELTIPWEWPDRHHDAEQLLSPVTIDGNRHGVSSPQELATVLANVRGTDLQDDHDSASELLVDLRDTNAPAPTQDWQNTDEQRLTLDDLLREEPPDDLGFSTGLGY